MQRFLLPKRGCKRQRSLCTCQRLCTVLLHSCYPWRTAQKDIYLFLLDPSSPLQKGTCWKQQRWDCSAPWGAPCPRTHHPKGNTAHLAEAFCSFPATVCPRTQREDHHETLRGVPQFGAFLISSWGGWFHFKVVFPHRCTAAWFWSFLCFISISSPQCYQFGHRRAGPAAFRDPSRCLCYRQSWGMLVRACSTCECLLGSWTARELSARQSLEKIVSERAPLLFIDVDSKCWKLLEEWDNPSEGF